MGTQSGEVRCYDAARAELRWTVAGALDGAAAGISCAPDGDGTVVAMGRSGGAALLDLATGGVKARFQVSEGCGRTCKAVGICVVVRAGQVRAWRVRCGATGAAGRGAGWETVRCAWESRRAVRAAPVSWSKACCWMARCAARFTRRCSTPMCLGRPQEKTAPFPPLTPGLQASKHPLSAVAALPGGLALVAGSGVALFDTAAGARVHKFTGHATPVAAVAASTDGRFILTAAEGERHVAVWNATPSKSGEGGTWAGWGRLGQAMLGRLLGAGRKVGSRTVAVLPTCQRGVAPPHGLWHCLL